MFMNGPEPEMTYYCDVSCWTKPVSGDTHSHVWQCNAPCKPGVQPNMDLVNQPFDAWIWSVCGQNGHLKCRVEVESMIADRLVGFH